MIKQAKELLELSKTRNKEFATKVLSGLRESIIEGCIARASEGYTFCSIDLENMPLYPKDILLEKCVEIVSEFEKSDYGYIVSIDDYNNDKKIVLTFSWEDRLHGDIPCRRNHLYDTYREILNKWECV